MTERFLDWTTYSAMVDQLFGGLGLTTVALVIIGLIIWRASMTVFKIFLKVIFGLAIIGLGLAWYWQLF